MAYSSDKTKKQAKRRTANTRSPFRRASKRTSRQRNYRQRQPVYYKIAKRYSYHFTRHKKLVFIARHFKTNRQSRTQKRRQLIIPIPRFYVSTLRELVFYIQPTRQAPVRHHLFRQHKLTPRTAGAIISVIGIVGMVSFAIFGLPAAKSIDLPEQSPASASVPLAPANQPPSLSRSIPVHIAIPDIGVDAPITQVGKAEDGTIQTPGNGTDTAWYKQSPTPGEIGPAIIVGHVDWINNVAVFWKLRELKPGNTVIITREDGSKATFKVDSLSQFSQTSFPTEQVYGNIDFAGLRLITCSGSFNSQTYQYSDNTVVFASLIDQKS